MAKIIAVTNQKGGVGKTTSTLNIGAGLVRSGKKVLLIDADPQGSLSISLGLTDPGQCQFTLSEIFIALMNDQEIQADVFIQHHSENIDFIPANISLSSVEVNLTSVVSREHILESFIDLVADLYDYILIDCMPSLGMITINSLTCADSVLIPVQAAYLPLKGLEQLFDTIRLVRRKLNRRLSVEGILLTMIDTRSNYSKDIIELVHQNYDNAGVFETTIPNSVKTSEAGSYGISMFSYLPRHKVTLAYADLVKEIISKE